MERECLMDCLLCGDVGYGKIEVVICVVFKVIGDGKQVVLFVLIMILVQQYYEIIIECFQDYLINIGFFSRFRMRKEVNEMIKGLKNGIVDIVIGMYWLLLKDVVYKDLGFFIIDEEQCFGVIYKEKIKQIKVNVDVLILIVMLILCMLYMFMFGVRDFLVIEILLENCFFVQIYVVEYNGVFVREVIECEFVCGGQVYFLYNWVEDIEWKVDEILMFVFDVKVVYVYGKMIENELEIVMLNFFEGELDVFVSIIIIEIGVDILNVNMLIVFDVDKMGFFQFYQLWGCVGCFNCVVYVYFMYCWDKVLIEVVEKRLQVIKEFIEFGFGFKIVMCDLMICGVGNFFGVQQYGFIDLVGFDFYL